MISARAGASDHFDESLGTGSSVPILAALTMATKTNVDIDITSDMLTAGLQVLVDSGVLDRGAGRELPTGADEVLVADIYKAMVRARSRDAAVHVTLPGVIEPGAELVVKNESDHAIRVVADPHETLTLKTGERSRD
jgi:hypothetical protein